MPTKKKPVDKKKKPKKKAPPGYHYMPSNSRTT